jgi:hypothetical protein
MAGVIVDHYVLARLLVKAGLRQQLPAALPQQSESVS